MIFNKVWIVHVFPRSLFQFWIKIFKYENKEEVGRQIVAKLEWKLLLKNIIWLLSSAPETRDIIYIWGQIFESFFDIIFSPIQCLPATPSYSSRQGSPLINCKVIYLTYFNFHYIIGPCIWCENVTPLLLFVCLFVCLPCQWGTRSSRG